MGVSRSIQHLKSVKDDKILVAFASGDFEVLHILNNEF